MLNIKKYEFGTSKLILAEAFSSVNNGPCTGSAETAASSATEYDEPGPIMPKPGCSACRMMHHSCRKVLYVES
jgi:hypothetical protein